MDNINFDKSIEKERLVFKSETMEIFDMIIFVFVSMVYIVIFVFVFVYDGLIHNNLNISGLIIYPSLLIFIIFLLFQKLRDKRFIKIETGYSQKDNRKIIKDYLQEQSWDIGYDNKEYLRASIPFTWTWGKEITIIFQEKQILLNVLSKNPLVRMPTFFIDKKLANEIRSKTNACPAYNNEQIL